MKWRLIDKVNIFLDNYFRKITIIFLKITEKLYINLDDNTDLELKDLLDNILNKESDDSFNSKES